MRYFVLISGFCAVQLAVDKRRSPPPFRCPVECHTRDCCKVPSSGHARLFPYEGNNSHASLLTLNKQLDIGDDVVCLCAKNRAGCLARNVIWSFNRNACTPTTAESCVILVTSSKTSRMGLIEINKKMFIIMTSLNSTILPLKRALKFCIKTFEVCWRTKVTSATSWVVLRIYSFFHQWNTFIPESEAEVQIEGYTFIVKWRDSGPGGSVGVYISSSILFQRRMDLEQENVECILIEILFPKTKGLLVGIIYRPPDFSKYLCVNFNCKFKSMLSTVSAENKECIILGDINCKFWCPLITKKSDPFSPTLVWNRSLPAPRELRGV